MTTRSGGSCKLLRHLKAPETETRFVGGRSKFPKAVGKALEVARSSGDDIKVCRRSIKVSGGTLKALEVARNSGESQLVLDTTSSSGRDGWL